MQTAYPQAAGFPVIADFTVGGARTSAKLTISALINGRRHNLEIVEVADKRQARRICAARGAQAWNF
jgi:hypothetical protein